MAVNTGLFDSIRRFAGLRTSLTNAGRILIILLMMGMLIGAKPGQVSAAGNTYYVDNTVTCSNSGPTSGTLALPYCTIGQGAAKAKLPGDTVHVLHGTYAETVNTPYSGVEGNPITFKADPGVTVTGAVCPPEDPCSGSGFQVGQDSYIVIDGFKVTETPGKAIHLIGSHHITVINNEVSYAGADPQTYIHEVQGIVLSKTTDSIISNNVTHHNTCTGIRLVNNSDYNVISNNTSYANASVVRLDAAGIDVLGSSHNIIINNTVYGNEDSGISIYAFTDTEPVPPVTTQSTDNVSVGNLSYGNADHGIDHNNSPYNSVIGNTFHGNGTVGINFEGGSLEKGSHHGLVMNNIVVSNGFDPVPGAFGGNLRVDKYSIEGTVLDYNIYLRDQAELDIVWNNVNYTSLANFKSQVGGQEENGIEADPLFVAPLNPVLRDPDETVSYSSDVSGDYHLQSGSPAIDRANSDAPHQLATDLFGKPRVDDPAKENLGAGVRTYDDIGAIEFQPAVVPQTPPTVLTVGAENMETTSVQVTGHITNLGTPNATEHGFVWGTAENPTTAGDKTAYGAPNSTGAFNGTISGLNPGTLYHVRAYATNATGTVYGADVTFTTLVLPTVYTEPVTNVTTTTVTGNGHIDVQGSVDPIEYGIVWGTSANPTTNKVVSTSADITGDFSAQISGLTPGTLYYVRAYAVYIGGTVYGENVSFTTVEIPAITTLPVSGITATTAKGNGNISNLDASNPTEYGIVWGTSLNPTISGSKAPGVSTGVPGDFTADITGLTAGTLYHVRAYVTYESTTVYGNDVTFTSSVIAPVVTTQAVTQITLSTATANGNLTALGVPNPTQYGFVWSTSANPTTADSKTTAGPASKTGAFTAALTGLKPGTLYHIRAYATNSGGTVYGADVTFTMRSPMYLPNVSK